MKSLSFLIFLAALAPIHASAAPVGCRDWSFQGLGGRYGFAERCSISQTKGGFERHLFTRIFLGPLGQCSIGCSAPVTALTVAAGAAAIVGLILFGIMELIMESRRVNSPPKPTAAAPLACGIGRRFAARWLRPRSASGGCGSAHRWVRNRHG